MKLLTLSPDQILPPLVPMRDGVDDEGMLELEQDVRQNGVRVPITVVAMQHGYRVVAGHRRWRAAQRAGLAEIPAVLKVLDEEAEVGEMLAENLHREQPNPLEEARVFAIFQEATNRTVAEVAAHVKKSPQYVRNRLALLHGPDDVKQALRDKQITLSVAIELARCEHDGDRAFLLSHAISGGATSATVNRWVRDQQLQRASQAAPGAAPGQPIVITQYDTIMATCEWHRGQVPMESTLSFRVCGVCFQELQAARKHVEALERGEPHDRGGEAPTAP